MDLVQISDTSSIIIDKEDIKEIHLKKNKLYVVDNDDNYERYKTTWDFDRIMRSINANRSDIKEEIKREVLSEVGDYVKGLIELISKVDKN